MVAAGIAHLPVIGEPEAAVGVEDDIVGTFQPFTLETVVERRYRARGQVDALDRTARFGVGGMAGEEQAARLDPFEPAIVADIGGAVGTDRQPVRRSEEHTSELQSLIRISYAVFWLKKKN